MRKFPLKVSVLVARCMAMVMCLGTIPFFAQPAKANPALWALGGLGVNQWYKEKRAKNRAQNELRDLRAQVAAGYYSGGNSYSYYGSDGYTSYGSSRATWVEPVQRTYDYSYERRSSEIRTHERPAPVAAPPAPACPPTWVWQRYNYYLSSDGKYEGWYSCPERREGFTYRAKSCR